MEESSAIREVRRRYGVPDAIRLRADPREVLAWLGDCEVAVRAVAARPDGLPRSGRGGRAALARLETPEGRVLVRAYRKGGLLRRLRGPGLRGPWRPLQELVLHRRLEALGVPVARAIGCVVRRGTLGWQGWLLVREVEGATDLEAWLHGVAAPGHPDRRRTLWEVGRTVRMLHDAGVPHPDLHPKNLLLAPDARVLVLDLDKAAPQERLLEEEARLANLVRLGRAVEKHRLKGLRAGAGDALRFLEGYAGSRAAARLWHERVRRRLRRCLGVRMLWWRLKGEARPWRPPGAAHA